MFRRLCQFSVPSALGVAMAGLVAALAETVVHTGDALEALAGAGFLLVFALPLGFALSLGGRALLQAWQLESLLSSLRDERGAAPRFAAWALFFLLAAALLGVGTFQGMRLLFASTRVNALIALGAPVVAVAITALLAALSRPLVDLLERPLAALESRRARGGRPALLTPLLVTLSLVLLALGAAAVTWLLVILPNIGHLDISFVRYLAVFFLALIGLPVAWQRLQLPRSARRAVAVLLGLGVAASLLAATWTRYERPYNMLAIWGETKLAGWAIDTIYDVQSLRVDLEIEGIEPTPLPGASHPDIVLITVDTVRADFLPLYGGKAKMPALAALAKRAAVVERAFSPGNVTRRSLPTLATGLSPRRVRGRVVGWALRMDPRHILLAERLRAGGYETAGFFCCRSHFGRDHKLGLIRGLEQVEIEYEGGALSKKSAAWLRKRGRSQRPLFLWTHYIEPHNWAKDHKPKKGARTRKERYQKSLEATDGFLAELLAGVREALGKDTIVVVTADHGEGLGDHGIKNHSGSLYNSEIRVPLVIAGAGISPGRMEQVVGLVDLAPTILELAGFEPPGMPQMDGLSIAPELLGKREDGLGKGEAYALMVADRSVQANQAAIISGHYKLIEREGSKYQLYDLTKDPGEKRDIKGRAPELLEAMKARLARRRALDRVSPF